MGKLGMRRHSLRNDTVDVLDQSLMRARNDMTPSEVVQLFHGLALMETDFCRDLPIFVQKSLQNALRHDYKNFFETDTVVLLRS